MPESSSDILVISSHSHDCLKRTFSKDFRLAASKGGRPKIFSMGKTWVNNITGWMKINLERLQQASENIG